MSVVRRGRIIKTAAAVALFAMCLPVLRASANNSPDTPIITEPAQDGQIVNPADVHMESTFSDSDPGDTHLCTDWEIWTAESPERVWATACIGSLEKVHTHLGDGVFENSHAGRLELLFDTDYLLRVRHRDDSGDAASEWSGWAERFFGTGPPSEIFPLELQDVVDAPEPQLIDAFEQDVVLPGSSDPHELRLETSSGQLLLSFQGDDGINNVVTNPAALTGHSDVRVTIIASSTDPLNLVESDLTFRDEDGLDQVIFLPAVNLEPQGLALYWVSINGSTYIGDPSQTEPDFSQLARGALLAWTVELGFKVELVATGFQLPVNIAFVPNPGGSPGDPYFYVTELYGNIKVVTGDGTVSDYASGLLNFDPTGNFPGSGEQGLTGILVDPTNGDVLASMLYDSVDNPGTHYPIIKRFQSIDGGLTASSESVVLDMSGESQGQSHQISALSIGPDSKLYVHMGDGFDFTTAQDLDSLRGKILRMNLDGSAAPDSPFYDASDGINARDYVYAYGFRNPFGGAWRASDGFIYEVENGPSIDRLARVVPGRNFGWIGTNESMLIWTAYFWQPPSAPVNMVFIQPQTFAGSGFPAEKMDHAFVSESGPTWAGGPAAQGKRINEFLFDEYGRTLGAPIPFVEYNGSGKTTVVGLAAGPDGLYFTDLYKELSQGDPTERGANILRVVFVGTADFVADMTTGVAPLTVQFTDMSDVPNATAWEWDFGEGNTSVEQHPSHTYAADGVFTVRLRVTGDRGAVVEQKNRYLHFGPTVYVNAAAAPGGNCLSWQTACQDLSQALILAQPGQQVWIAAGTYSPDPSGLADPREATFQLRSGVGLYGGFTGNENDLLQRDWLANLTVLSGEIGDTQVSTDNCRHVVSAFDADATAILDSLIVTKGNTDTLGGAGLLISGGAPTVTKCIFHDNVGPWGAGLLSSSASPRLTECWFVANSAVYGGGMMALNEHPELSKCSFYFNTATAAGGALVAIGSAMVLDRCVLNRNSADIVGGALLTVKGSGRLLNCQLFDNDALTAGGAVYAFDDNSTFVNCTVSGNTAGVCGGLFLADDRSSIANSILWNNTDGTGATSQAQITYTVTIPIVNTSTVQGGFEGLGNIFSDPLFVDGANGNMRLSVGSPCIERGNNGVVPLEAVTDIIGNPRIVDGNNNGVSTVDMGAFEFNP